MLGRIEADICKENYSIDYFSSLQSKDHALITEYQIKMHVYRASAWAVDIMFDEKKLLLLLLLHFITDSLLHTCAGK